MEDEHDARAASLAILQYQLSTMIFHDLLDDGEAQPGALGPRRDVRLGQALAALGGQAAAVVLDDERGLPARLDDPYDDLARRRVAIPRLNRFRCILQQVDKRLTDLAGIAREALALGNVEGEGDLGRRRALQERRLSH